jgi:hypothetical protein
MINENIELSDDQLAVVTGGGDKTTIKQNARGTLRQRNTSYANTKATLNGDHSEGAIDFGVAGASVGQGNTGVVIVSNNA